MPRFATHTRRAAAAATAVALGFAGALVIAPAAHAANFTVTSNADAGAGTLRQAILDANSGAFPGSDTITFSPAVTSITLASTIPVSEGLIIDGPGPASLMVTRNGDFEMFEFDMASANQNVTLEGVYFDGGAGTTQRGLDFMQNNPVHNLVLANSEFAEFQTTVLGGAVLIEELTGNLIIVTVDFHDNASTGNASVPSLYAEDIDSGFVSISDSNFYGNSGESGSGLKILFSEAEITIADSSFTDNTSTNAGAGAYLFSLAGVTVRNTVFTNNDASANAAGSLFIGQIFGQVSIEDSGFANSDSDFSGGAVVVDNVDGFEIIDSAFVSNSADAPGGAVSATLTGSTLISGSVFASNSSTAGGAIHFGNVNSSVEIRDSIFVSNSTFGNGGAIYFNSLDSGATISRTTFANNAATAGAGGASGAAIYATEVTSGNELFIDSSTFTDNVLDGGTFGTGGGVGIAIDTLRSFGGLRVLNSTFFEDNQGGLGAIFVNLAEADSNLIVQNSTIVADGGIRIGTNNGDAEVTNSIVDGDLNDVGRDAFRVDGGLAIVVSYSALSSGVDATIFDNGGNLFSVADMQLGALGDNGGPTDTMVPLAGSPVVNAGDPTFVAPPAVDQRGGAFVRVAGGRLDIGAAELQTLALAATGLEISPLLPIGVGVLLLLGAALMLAATRRRTA